MSYPYRAKDQTAIVGVADGPYARDSGRSATSMVLEACIEAITDAGLNAGDIDGIVGSQIAPAYAIQAGLGIPGVKWWCNPVPPFQQQLVEAINAVHAGMCSTVLCYHGNYRTAGTSRSAAGDPIRQRYGTGTGYLLRTPDTMFGPHGYAAWCGRYLHEYGVSREVLGLVAINSRTNAGMNPNAAMRKPLSMEAYLEAPMIRFPYGMLDMDFPVDAADAFVITTTERARSLRKPPVLIHVAAMGSADVPHEDQAIDLNHTGQATAAKVLWERSDIPLEDVDLYLPYDGFTGLTVKWFESTGFCGDGEAFGFFQDNWDKTENRLRINGRVLVNSHGGSLSAGATQGAGHIREAVLQLRGEAGDRQSPDVNNALLTLGGLFYNCGALMLHTDK